MTARWSDPSLAGVARTVPANSVWIPTLLVVNERSVDESLDDIVRIDADGNARLTRRLMGEFTARMDLRAFPRDRQRLRIWVVAPPFDGPPVELVPGPRAENVRADTLSIPDWTLAPPELIALDYLLGADRVEIPGMTLEMEATRKLGYYLIQVLLPLLAVVLMAWSVFWIDSSIVTTRVSVVVTTMLTLIAYRFMLGNLVPRLSYLTRLDYFMLSVTGLVIITLFAMAATSFFREREKLDIVRRIDLAGRVGFPVLLALVTLLLWAV